MPKSAVRFGHALCLDTHDDQYQAQLDQDHEMISRFVSCRGKITIITVHNRNFIKFERLIYLVSEFSLDCWKIAVSFNCEEPEL